MTKKISNEVRPRLDCSTGVKTKVREIRKALNLPTDSDVLAYLLVVYEDHYERITLPKDKSYREKAEVINKQMSF